MSYRDDFYKAGTEYYNKRSAWLDSSTRRNRRLSVPRFDFICRLLTIAIVIALCIGLLYAFYTGRNFNVRTFAEGFFTSNFSQNINFIETIQDISSDWPDWLDWIKPALMPVAIITLSVGYVIVWAFSALDYIIG